MSRSSTHRGIHARSHAEDFLQNGGAAGESSLLIRKRIELLAQLKHSVPALKLPGLLLFSEALLRPPVPA